MVQEYPMANRKILLVDDEPSVLKMLSRRLQESHYDVVTASDGIQALDILPTIKPDLIISDIMMPNMDGYTFITKLRNQPALANIPVIILTAKDKMQDLFLFKGVKTCDYIVKPFETEELLQKIAQLLARVDAHLGSPPPKSA